ncbi:MAG: DNA topoisomerase (ATP-hydrolyzing) subunit A [Mycoplasmataceae bacterium]|jgi:DNA gyrase subunit A|nr:DNA topoisomerase (ATP-hydrolyzing) subunit A [Mycoplasmataceae bacterium]
MAKKTLDEIRDDLKKTKIIDSPISKEVESSFLEYAMSVIISRAIPDARDGLKPVHRRVLYATYSLGISSDKPHKKCARICGETSGKFHPHGESAIYETLVRMAQDFSLRYPLIDGHGNFGSIDDGPAAMRYTEARLSKIGDIMLNDIDKNTVQFIDNYDASEVEPSVLPSIFPNMLVNGSSGIAVGMATNIPTHNLCEIVEAIKLFVHKPNITVDEIMSVLKGPDFPTGAEIIGASGIDSYFRTGKGKIIIRAKTNIKTLENGKSIITITELPYMVSKKTLIDKIVELSNDKIIEGITDLQDFTSSREGLKIEIETKRDVIPEVLLNQLFKTTPLQTTFAVNILALINGEPRVLNILDAISIYVDHQIDILIKKTNFELKKASDRKHILEGLHIASMNIDEVISIIKNAIDTSDAMKKLMSKFNLTEIQSKAILDMRLRSLSGLERKKIEDELKQVIDLITYLENILSSKEKQISIIEAELENLAKKFGDQRKTNIRYDITSDIDDEDLIPKEDILITMSSKGYLKRMPINTYKVQRRGGVGVTGLQTHDDDDVEKIISANTHTDILFFTDSGRVFRIRGHKIPALSRQSKGIPAINMIGIEKNEKILSILPIDSYENACLFFCTKNGIVKKTDLEEFVRINSSGKIAITLKENDKLFNVISVAKDEEIYIGASNGNMVRFNENQVRSMGRTAAGVHGINLIEEKEFVVGLSSSSEGNKILSIGNNGTGKMTDIDEYRLTKRNAKGVRTLKINEKTGKLVYIGAVNGNEDVLIITNSGKVIRFLLSSINTIGRSTSGVKLINIEKNEKVQSVTLFKYIEAQEQEENSQEENSQEEKKYN